MRPVKDADRPFLLTLYGGFRAADLAATAWSDAQKAAFVADQFRLQDHHFKTHFPHADCWIVQRGEPGQPRRPIGRFYIDRSDALWRAIDLGFIPEWRGRGLGGALLGWMRDAARTAGAAGVDLHVLTTNTRAQALYARLGFRVETLPDGPHRRMVWRAE